MALTFRTGSGGKGSALTIEELDNNFRHFSGSHTVSGTLTIDYDNVGGYALFITSSDSHQTPVLIQDLPTSEPLVTGSLWLSGSGAGNASGSQYLMVFNG
tara:strand:- start:2069 stop:2368 length:300 start_codon:yes stop_codon:yes gene_type:complete